MGAPKYRRSIFLINKEFQLRFSFYVCSWLIVLSLAYPLIISNLFDYFIHYLAADPMGPGLAVLEKTRHDVFVLLMVMQAILLTLAFLISIFMSHKIAGPLYKMRRYFSEARDGNISQPLFFRRKDYFMELVPAYNEMMRAIQKRIAHRDDTITAAIKKLEPLSTKASPEIATEIQEILATLTAAQKI